VVWQSRGEFRDHYRDQIDGAYLLIIPQSLE
jgi:hypothetical protein